MNDVQTTPAAHPETHDTGPDDRELHGSAKEGTHAHPGNAEYVRIAIILAVLTAIEVALFYMEDAGIFGAAVLVPSLIGLAFVKFLLVAMFFMHLKFDSPVFSAFFTGALITTILAFVAVLSMFRALF